MSETASRWQRFVWTAPVIGTIRADLWQRRCSIDRWLAYRFPGRYGEFGTRTQARLRKVPR